MSGSPVHAPSRLVVNGSRVLQPDGSPIRLTGFNWQIGRVGPDPGAEMRTLAPGANVARLVGVLWGNALPLGERHPDRDCMTTEPPHFFDDECFSTLDPLVRSATDAGLWVILAVRGEYVAGQNYEADPGSCVFRNGTLRSMAYAMWRHVAAHYRSFDRIAAYELLSEPRDKTVGSAAVRGFYEGACATAHSADAPCHWMLYQLPHTHVSQVPRRTPPTLRPRASSAARRTTSCGALTRACCCGARVTPSTPSITLCRRRTSSAPEPEPPPPPAASGQRPQSLSLQS